MLTADLFLKLKECLNEEKVDFGLYPFNLRFEDNKNLSWTGKYVSLNLLVLTGIAKYNLYLFNEKSTKIEDYDIDLINQITKLLYESGDEDLKNIAWNTFFEDCQDDERFILYKEINAALDEKDELYEKGINFNHTKELETENLLIRPQRTEDSEIIADDFIEYDLFNIHHTSIVSTCDETCCSFNLFLKSSNDLIGAIAFDFGEDQLDDKMMDVHYYLMEKYKNNIEYLKEGLQAIINAFRERKVVLYCEKHKKAVFEEWIPNPEFLAIECKDDDTNSNEIAKYLGFEFTGGDTEFVFWDDKDDLRTNKTNIYLLKVNK